MDICIDRHCGNLVDDGINGGLKCLKKLSPEQTGSECIEYHKVRSCRTCKYAGPYRVYETGTLDAVGHTCILQNNKEIFMDITPLLSNFASDVICPINKWVPRKEQSNDTNISTCKDGIEKLTDKRLAPVKHNNVMTLVVVFDRNFDKILVCKRTKSPWKGKCNFVGGKVEQGESEKQCAERELYEETGILPHMRTEMVHIMDLKYYWKDRSPDNLAVFSTVLKEIPTDISLKEEVNKLMWVDLGECNIFDLETFAGDGNMGNMIFTALRYYFPNISNIRDIDQYKLLPLHYITHLSSIWGNDVSSKE